MIGGSRRRTGRRRGRAWWVGLFARLALLVLALLVLTPSGFP